MKTRFPIAMLLSAALLAPVASLPAQVNPNPDEQAPPPDAPRPRPARLPEAARPGPPPDRGPRQFRGPGGPGNQRPPDGDYDNFSARGSMMGDPYWGLPPGRAESRTLVVGGANMDAPVLAALEEDLAVMAHLLEKSLVTELGQPSSSAMGIPVVARGNSRVAQSLYLDGYGVMFQIGVAFPLVPSPAAAREEERPPARLSPWEEAQREIFGPRGRGEGWAGLPPFGRRQAEYQPDRVEALKRNLLETLKNAANIRNLKAEEYITIMVTGPENPANWRPGPRVTGEAQAAPARGDGAKDRAPAEPASSGAPAWAAASHQPVLSIRARRADIDAYAGGKLSADEFRQKATVNLN